MLPCYNVLLIFKQFNLPKDIAKEINDWVLGDIRRHKQEMHLTLNKIKRGESLDVYYTQTNQRPGYISLIGQNLDFQPISISIFGLLPVDNDGHDSFLKGNLIGSTILFSDNSNSIMEYETHTIHIFNDNCIFCNF